jgi:hypothetical protein
MPGAFCSVKRLLQKTLKHRLIIFRAHSFECAFLFCFDRWHSRRGFGLGLWLAALPHAAAVGVKIISILGKKLIFKQN